jgi:hypothetical protein
MDCIDCHNRIGHEYYPPDRIVNVLLSLKLIDPLLPDIKSTAVQALEGNYTSREAARSGIRDAITEFYTKKYPERASRSLSYKQQLQEGIHDILYEPKFFISFGIY